MANVLIVIEMAKFLVLFFPFRDCGEKILDGKRNNLIYLCNFARTFGWAGFLAVVIGRTPV